MFLLNELDTIVYFDDETMTEKVETEAKACFDIRIGDIKFPLFQGDDYVGELTVDQVNQMLNSITVSIVSNCESQIGKLNSLSIKDGNNVFTSWANKEVNKTTLAKGLFLKVEIEIEHIFTKDFLSLRLKENNNQK